LDNRRSCPLQAAHNISDPLVAWAIDPEFANAFDRSVFTFTGEPTAVEMLDFIEKTGRA
jgi:hypothetical protein